MLTAAELREFESSYKKSLEDTDRIERLKNVEIRQEQIEQSKHSHLDQPHWQTIIHGMEEAAKHGNREYQVIVFPSNSCSDFGRKINNNIADWEETLQGESADIYHSWSSELKDLGYKLVARVLTFPDGMPGDIGLFFTWGG